MTATTAFGDWNTPQPFALPELGPGVEGPLRKQIERVLRQIAADPKVRAVVIFGSRAQGRAGPQSDLDLLVVERTPHLEPQMKLDSWWRHMRLLEALPLSVDLVVAGSHDAAHLAGSRWHVISEAARHGRVVAVKP